MSYEAGDEYMVTETGSRFNMWALVLLGTVTFIMGACAGMWTASLIGISLAVCGIVAHNSFVRNQRVTGISALLCTALIGAIVVWMVCQ